MQNEIQIKSQNEKIQEGVLTQLKNSQLAEQIQVLQNQAKEKDALIGEKLQIIQ